MPASIIVTTTLQELEAGAGKALTGGGTLLPMSDVIRLAAHAHHYLAIFDNGKALALYHTKRLASPAQRIVLYAKDRGCSFPGCTVPGYLCEVHHCNPYATNPVTDINTSALPAAPTTNSPTDVPGYLCEVHHRDPYALHPVTDVNELTFACGPNHQLAEQGWTTRKNAYGQTEWIPPPHLDYGQPRVNTFHHPEKLLRAEEDDEAP